MSEHLETETKRAGSAAPQYAQESSSAETVALYLDNNGYPVVGIRDGSKEKTVTFSDPAGAESAWMSASSYAAQYCFERGIQTYEVHVNPKRIAR